MFSPEIPESAVAGIAWPALPSAGGARVLAICRQLRESQWWPPARMREAQFRQLGLLLDHARRSVPFYRRRFDAAGIDPGAVRDLGTWHGIPLLTRGDLQREDVRSTDVPASHRPIATARTSGSTGEPVTVTGTAIGSLMWRALTLRDHEWHGRDLSGRLASIRAPGPASAPLPQPGWGAPTDGLYATGPAGSLSLTTDIARQAEWLAGFDPDYLLTYPSNARALAAHCLAAGIRLPRLREVRTVGESLGPDTRRACRDAWGARVVDLYSAQEVGYIALQCSEHEHYHVQSENVLVEILDEAGRACAPGAIGRIVATSLHNFAMPLIRYELGDLAEAGDPCGCGRGLPVIQRIVGRSRNLLRLPTGERYWPRTGFMGFDQIAPVSQYQFIQRRLDYIEVRLVVPRPLSDNEQTALRAHIRQSLGYPFEIGFTYLEAIPRGAGGKFEDFMSELGPRT